MRRPILGVGRRGQREMQQLEQTRFRLAQSVQRCELVPEQNRGQSGVRHRVVRAFADQFVVLDESMVGILRESERRERQRVDHRQAEDRMPRGGLAQHRQVVPHQVMTQHQPRAARHPPQFLEPFVLRGLPWFCQRAITQYRPQLQ